VGGGLMENFINSIKFNDSGLVPAIVQDHQTNEVLMMAYMDAEAVQKTLSTKLAHYYSRSRQKLWLKGETSGHYQHIKSISIDCDNDTLLLKVEQKEAACHTGHYSCFFRELTGDKLEDTGEMIFSPEKVYDKASVLKEVYNVIVDRTVNPKEGSYTNYLLTKGIDKILKKVGEETAEVIIAAKNNSRDEIRYEVSDLMYHLMVMMVDRGVTLEDIYEELGKRR
jgi:phosphoribosyl-AMP cyclohydrolase / phosphoribosyl-ATP pyrophosphohydrolase